MPPGPRSLGANPSSGHNSLHGRSQPRCHPIQAVEGLEERLQKLEETSGAQVGNAQPQPVAIGGPSHSGTDPTAAREDHRHAMPLATATAPGAVILGPGGAKPWEAPEGVIGAGDTGSVAVWEDGRIGEIAGFQARPDEVLVPALRATDQAHGEDRLVVADAGGRQRADARLVIDPGEPDTIPWIGYWDMEGGAGNLTPGAGGAFTAAVPGYGGYALAPLDTDTPLAGSQSLRIPGSGLYGRYATWSPSAFGDITFGCLCTSGTVIDIGPANADDGVAPAFRAGAWGDANSNFQVYTTLVSVDAIPELLAGPTHVAWRYTSATRLLERFVNGVFFDSYTVPAGSVPSTVGCIGSYFNGSRMDRVAVVAGLLTDQQIADLAAGVAWDEITPTYNGPPTLVLGPAIALRVLDHADATQRMLIARADGTHTPAAEAQWENGSGHRRLNVTWGGDGFVGTNTISTGTGYNAVAAHQTVGAGGEFGIQASWCAGNGQTVGGVSAAQGVGFVAYGTNKVFYGSHASGSAPVVYFVHDTAISARYDANGWRLARRIQVDEDAGTGQRLLTAQPDGHHVPVPDITWTGSALAIAAALTALSGVFGTDPGGSETVRIGGAVRTTGAVTITAAATSASGAIQLTSTTPGIGFSETDAAADAKNWDVFSSSGTITLRFLDDARSVANTILTVSRSGAVPVTLAIHPKVGYAGGESAPIANDPSCYIYRTDATGSGIFAEAGHLVLQGRTSTSNRGVIILAGSTTPVEVARFLAGATTITGALSVTGVFTLSGVTMISGATSSRLVLFGGSSGDGAAVEIRGSTFAGTGNAGYLRVGSTYVANWGPTAFNVAQNFTVTGSTVIGTDPGGSEPLRVGGAARFNSGVIAGASSAISATSTSGLLLTVRNLNNGTGAYARVNVQADVAASISVDQFSSSYTGTVWGIALANYAVISGSSSISNGIIIGHTADKPIILGINTSEVARFTSGTLASGSFQVKYTGNTAIDCSGFINVASGKGYRVNGVQVLGAQGAAVADATGGVTVDTEARAAINALLARMRAHGAIAT